MNNIWKNKLAAYLHDPPSKCLDIGLHEVHAQTLYRQAGFSEEEAKRMGEQYAKPSDWTASAADRLPFPRRQISCAFDGVRNAFTHPLGAKEKTDPAPRIPFSGPFITEDAAKEVDQEIQPTIRPEHLTGLSDDEVWKRQFFAHWRLWRRNAVEKDHRFNLLPAETRLPDHSVWNHMQVVSALDTCSDGTGPKAKLTPAFLKFQLGPVQDFIAAGRSTRDLWSGSYLLSWLMAAGMKALSSQIGPDSVLFPNLYEQPLFDLHWKRDLWDKIKLGDKTGWQSLEYDQNDSRLLTPNLPNVFLAVVPQERATELAKGVEEAIQDEWQRIAKDVWSYCEEASLTSEDLKARFDKQVEKFLTISWLTTPWPQSPEDALNLSENFTDDMPIGEARKRVQAIIDMAEKQMPEAHRDSRYYVGQDKGPKQVLNNVGLAWSVILAFNSWQLDAVRQTCDFQAQNSGGWDIDTTNNKDSLTGKEEAVAGGRVWFETCQKKLKGSWKSRFKKEHWLGAPTLIKRLWDIAYLEKEWDLPIQTMPNTRGLAEHDPFAKDENNDDDQSAAVDEIVGEPKRGKYFAVLAFDGDQIGKWISGEKTPTFGSQLANYKDGSGNPGFGSKPYFEAPHFEGFLDSQRPVSPSYHLQFSEALGNFALRCTRTIVEAYLGRLIYAGGDDVVALLPADTALGCAKALRTAFQGADCHGPKEKLIFSSPAPGYLQSDQYKDQLGNPIPFIVPGPAADASVGIAIAHFKAPLQDIVRQAQAAEKRAKRSLENGGHDRAAVAITLMKHSGEIQHWGTKWDHLGVEAYQAVLNSMTSGVVSNKFPHRVIEYLEPLRPVHGQTSAKTFDKEASIEIVSRFIELTADNQRGQKYDKGEITKLILSITAYANKLPGPDAVISDLIHLMTCAAFAARTDTQSQPKPQPANA